MVYLKYTKTLCNDAVEWLNALPRLVDRQSSEILMTPRGRSGVGFSRAYNIETGTVQVLDKLCDVVGEPVYQGPTSPRLCL